MILNATRSLMIDDTLTFDDGTLEYRIPVKQLAAVFRTDNARSARETISPLKPMAKSSARSTFFNRPLNQMLEMDF